MIIWNVYKNSIKVFGVGWDATCSNLVPKPVVPQVNLSDILINKLPVDGAVYCLSLLRSALQTDVFKSIVYKFDIISWYWYLQISTIFYIYY